MGSVGSSKVRLSGLLRNVVVVILEEKPLDPPGRLQQVP